MKVCFVRGQKKKQKMSEGKINFYNVDCVEFMKDKPDNYYDLAIVDPPYGIGAGSSKFINRNTANKRAESPKAGV